MSPVELTVLAVVVGALIASVIAAVRADRKPISGDGAGDLMDVDLFDVEFTDPREPRIVHAFEIALLVGLLGYVLFDRAFAWVHVPSAPAFVGELLILFGVLAMLSSRTSLVPALRRSPPLQLLVVYMAWGAALLVFLGTRYGLDAVRDSALWYYGIAAIFVAFLIVSDPRRLGRWSEWFARAIPAILVWFPVAILIRSVVPADSLLVPDSEISVFNHRTGNIAVVATIIIGYLWMVDAEHGRFSRRQRTGLTVLAAATLFIAGFQNRGGLVAGILALALMLVFLRRRRSEVVLVIGGLAVTAVVVLLVSGLSVSLGGGREISAEQLIDNVVSTVRPSEGDSRQTSTTQWRLDIWKQVLDDVTNERPITGFGPGPDLGARYDISGTPEAPLRNPHNSHVGILARMGWAGIGLWVVLWLTWTLQLLNHRAWLDARNRSRERGFSGWLIVSAAAILVNAIFDPTLEGPQVAMLLWFLFGLGAVLPVLHQRRIMPAIFRRQEPDPATIG